MKMLMKNYTGNASSTQQKHAVDEAEYLIKAFGLDAARKTVNRLHDMSIDLSTRAHYSRVLHVVEETG